MAEYLNDSKLREYTQLFCHFDYECQGLIKCQSLMAILQSMHLRLSIQQVKQLLKETGSSSPNYSDVTLTEFLAIISIVIEDKDMNREIFDLFEVFDTDKNKIINKDDFGQGFKQLQTELSEEDMIKLIQSTGKDCFNLREFRKYLLER